MFARPSFRHIPLRAPLAILKHSISSKATIARKPIYLNLVVPPSLKPELLKFESTSHFVDFVKSYRGRGSLKYPSSENPGQYDIISPRKSSTFSPSITYELLAPGGGDVIKVNIVIRKSATKHLRTRVGWRSLQTWRSRG
jgi:hypothetical protein